MARSSLLLLLLCLGCVGKVPVWDGKIYAGDHQRQAVVRAQENEIIMTSDPRFSGGVWMTYEDLRSFYELYVLGCKEWKSDVKLERADIIYKRVMPLQEQ